MKNKSIYLRDDLAFAMRNCKTLKFNSIDLFTLEVLLADTYTNDAELAKLLLCSMSTIKRSINKLCNYGFISKHITYKNTKIIELHQDVVNIFLNTYFYAEPYYSKYIKDARKNGEAI